MAKSDKKTLRKQVEIKLAENFSDIKIAVGDKKFAKKVKKAGNILVAGAVVKSKKAIPQKAKAKNTRSKKGG